MGGLVRLPLGRALLILPPNLVGAFHVSLGFVFLAAWVLSSDFVKGRGGLGPCWSMPRSGKRSFLVRGFRWYRGARSCQGKGFRTGELRMRFLGSGPIVSKQSMAG